MNQILLLKYGVLGAENNILFLCVDVSVLLLPHLRHINYMLIIKERIL